MGEAVGLADHEGVEGVLVEEAAARVQGSVEVTRLADVHLAA